MAVTVISRPVGYKLDPNPVSATVTDDGGDALFNSDGHGLSEANIYIESNIDSYNGFGFVASGYGCCTFKVEKNGEFIPFKQEADVIYYFERLAHAWQCVHLPIVYELSNDFYPVNSVDTAASIIIYTDYNGYLSIGHNALTGGSALSVLDYVRLTDGVNSIIVQVIGVPLTTNTYVDLPYGGYTYTTIQKVRNNYHIDVNVYAGLPAGHTWESEKPYELATTLRFIPDSNNQIKFSIAEILKGYITTRNNLTLDTLPNNIDFFTSFYIEYAEGYDVSDGNEITAFTGEFQDDDFEGYAVNAMLPFKNLYSGFMSSYLLSDTSPKAFFLTTFDVPSLYENYFFDISILVKEGLPQLYIKKVWYFTDGTVSHTEEDEILDFDEGVYRIQLEAQCSRTYDEVTTYIDSEWLINVEGWYQGAGSFTDNWGWGNTPDYFGDGTGYVYKDQEVSEYPSYRHAVSIDGGQSVRLRFKFGAITDLTNYSVEVVAIDQATGDQYQVAPPYTFFKDTGSGDEFLTVDEYIVMPTDVSQVHFNEIGFIISGGFGVGNAVFMDYFRITSEQEVTKDINKVIISITDGSSTVYSEEKTINVICECGDTFVNDDLRLLEGSGVRKLE